MEPARIIPEDLIGTREAGAIVRTSKNTVIRWIITGRLTGYRAGRTWYVSRADLMSLIETFTSKDAKAKRDAQMKVMPATRTEIQRTEAWADNQLRIAGVRK